MARIGIIAHVDLGDLCLTPGKERFCINQDYVASVSRAGGIPLVLPMVKKTDDIRAQLDAIDGLLLSGGHDINPLIYGEEPIRQMGQVCTERDEYEIQAIKIAKERNLPIFAICRGVQILNVALGGTLFQDIPQQTNSPQQHWQSAKGYVACHSIEVMVDTLLHSICQTPKVMVNSFHHQSINKLAPGLTVSARSPDGIIEGVELPGASWVVGVQWHPERMTEHHDIMARLFNAFITAADTYA